MAEPPLWTLAELKEATEGSLQGGAPQTFNGVSIDSRALAPGDIFVAIRGERLDGHDFVLAALAQGAGIAVVSHVGAGWRSKGSFLLVPDTLEALGRMGRFARSRSRAQIIAVTGSVGKTTTKEALRLALSPSGNTHASASSFNNHWGVPLSLARMPPTAEFGVFEVGMNHAGEITPLSMMVRPHIAIITTIAQSHLGHFSSIEAIADAKAEIFAGVVEGGAAVINRDSPYFAQLAEAANRQGISRIYGFGSHKGAEIELRRMVLHETCSCVTASIFGEEVIYKLGLPGEHMVMNSLAVLGSVKLAGADLARAAVALAEFSAQKGRGVRFTIKLPEGEAVIIDESYNANPASMKAALAVLSRLKPAKGGRRIAVLGDMLELGERGPELHAGLAGEIDGSAVDVLYASGPLMQHLWDALPVSRRGRHAATSHELKDSLLHELKGGDVVMIKGSLGSRMGLLVEAIKTRFPAAPGAG